MSTSQFRGDLAFSDMQAHSATGPPTPPAPGASTLPDAEFPRFLKSLQDPGLEAAPDKRNWSGAHIYRKMRGWLFPNIQSRLLPGDFHPITAHFLVQYKCNLDWWYCWAFANRVKGMSEDVARRSIGWLRAHDCRLLAAHERRAAAAAAVRPQSRLLRRQERLLGLHCTNLRLLRLEVADRIGDAGVAVFNIALESGNIVSGVFTPVLVKYAMRVRYNWGRERTAL